ncbi:MAG: hypothetical protein FWE52_04230 [Alphaproteobacteria bacterium]|nr:hypothetical protein [Alphaproteobacteria bacterium]
MKKILMMVVAAIAVTGCTKEYYNGKVRYTQDNDNCIYRFSQGGDFAQKKFAEDKKVVYKEALCRDVLANDMAAAAPVARPVPMPQPVPVVRNVRPAPMSACNSCGCGSCMNPVIANTNRFHSAHGIEIIIE